MDPNDLPVAFQVEEVEQTVRTIKAVKSAGPEKIPGRGLKDYAHQFAVAFF